ncbi:MAG: hypothetical protein HY356_02450 [Gammaproteobacteria bacterium]|nr:hypothetical protein [Gammaproteobacteria bacterium]
MLNRLITLVLIFSFPTGFCYADPKIYSPIVKQGELAFENRGNTTVDDDDDNDGSQRHVFELEYGVTEWWKTAIVARLDEPSAGTLRYDSTAWENIFQLTGQGKYWLDTGWYLEYKLADEDGAPDKLETKLLLEKPVYGFLNTLNLTIEQELGSEGDEDLEFEYAWRTRKKITSEIKLGFEAFGKLGELRDLKSPEDQEHRIGPVFYHEFRIGGIEIEYNLAWLFGLTDASPDNTFRWQIEIPLE